MLADKLTLTMPETLIVCLIGIFVVMLELALIAVLVLLISRLIRVIETTRKKVSGNASDSDITIAPTAIAAAGAPEEDDGQLRLINTDEQTAALVMAIVSDQSGIPLERLRFKTIKLIEQEGN